MQMLQQAGSEDEEQAIGPIDITTYKLPVFCVSSREARKLEAAGSNKYGEATVFYRLADTQLPGLRTRITSIASSSRQHMQRQLTKDVYAAIDSVGRTLLSQVRWLRLGCKRGGRGAGASSSIYLQLGPEEPQAASHRRE